MFFPLVIYAVVKKTIRAYDIGELSIMICGLMLGTLAIVTMFSIPLYEPGVLIRVLMMIYIVTYIKVITRMLVALKQLLESTIL